MSVTEQAEELELCCYLDVRLQRLTGESDGHSFSSEWRFKCQQQDRRTLLQEGRVSEVKGQLDCPYFSLLCHER